MMIGKIGFDAHECDQFLMDPVSRFGLFKNIAMGLYEFLPFFDFGVHTKSRKVPGSIAFLVMIDLFFRKISENRDRYWSEFEMFHAEAVCQTIPRELRS